jgi:hypothetical protein
MSFSFALSFVRQNLKKNGQMVNFTPPPSYSASLDTDRCERLVCGFCTFCTFCTTTVCIPLRLCRNTPFVGKVTYAQFYVE